MARRRKASAVAREVLELPVLPVRDMVLFPHVVAPLVVGRERSVRAVDDAAGRDVNVLVVAQRDPEQVELGVQDLYEVGTEAIVGRLLRMPDGTNSALVQGQRRIRILEFTQIEPYLIARAEVISEESAKNVMSEALMRAVLALFEKVVKLARDMPEESFIAAMNAEEPGWLADMIASTLQLSIPQRQEILEVMEPVARLQHVSVLLARELDVLELQNEIHTQVQQEVDKSQREYFLREQLRIIQKELGESDPQQRDLNALRDRIISGRLPDEVRKRAEDELERLGNIPPASPEVSISRSYIEWLANLPWSVATEDCLDIRVAQRVLNENHYGLRRVKDRILEFMAVRKLAPSGSRSPVLCFVGPPGVGKTSLGRSIATALGRKFVRVSLGGIRDEAEIRGHRRTYVGAMPGRIIQTMRNAGTVNPVFMLDEVDKIGSDFRGDPSSALLEVLDPEQNHAFSDHYLEVPYNLSKVMFIATANVLDPVPPALQDRMEVIEIPGYTEDEKAQIARRFLVPRQLGEHGLDAGKLHFSDSAIHRLIRSYTREAGVRNLEREIATIIRKVARSVAEGKSSCRTITAHGISRYLGPERFFWGAAEEQDEVGAATGVVWTAAGGDVIAVEVTLMEGRGKLNLTGQLGDVMKESAQAAISYARSRIGELGLQPRVFDKTDIHIHVPAGAIPKDGPSAGITMASALISALTGKAVRRDVAMTGEITLRGKVLPVGGLKEKVLAAHRAGIKTFIMPSRNEKDLVDIPKDVRRALHFVHVDRMDQVLPVALKETGKSGVIAASARRLAP